MSSIGFTGTRRGMTEAQKATLRSWLRRTAPSFFHHGDCVGSDAEANQIAADLGIEIIIHPPKNPKLRAFCSKGVVQVLPAKDYLPRNRDIVNAAGGCLPFNVFATPSGYKMVNIGSGTWSTIRYAGSTKKTLCVIWPDGTYAPYEDLSQRIEL